MFKNHINLNGYTGTRVGENVGLVEQHYTYEELKDLAPDLLDINKISKSRKTNQNPNEITKFTQVLPPEVFKTARIDGVGTWNHTVIKGNGAEISYQGKRYINHVIPADTYPYMTTDDKGNTYARAMKALQEDELRTMMTLITTSIENKKVVDISTSGQNLKQDILDAIGEVEKKSFIPRKNLTLSLSMRAKDTLMKYEMGSIDTIMGNEKGNKNYWSVGDIVEAEIGQLPDDVFFMIHCPYLAFTVTYKPVTVPGFYPISQVQNSPTLTRFVVEDGYAMEYADSKVGLVVTDDNKEERMPYIEFTLNNIVVPKDAVLDPEYLKKHNNLRMYVDDYLEERKDVTNVPGTAFNFTSTVDTSVEGIYITQVAGSASIAGSVSRAYAKPKTLTVRVSDSLPATDIPSSDAQSDEVSALKAEVAKLKAAAGIKEDSFYDDTEAIDVDNVDVDLDTKETKDTKDTKETKDKKDTKDVKGKETK